MNSNNVQWASHDAGTLPWLAVAGYLVAAGLSWRRHGLASNARERLFWLVATLSMFLLGINKQLDLQTTLTEWGRHLAIMQGWYDERRAFQREFIVAALVAVSGLVFALTWLVRGSRAYVFVALGGLSVLGAFIMVRAASFHHIDVAMRTPVLGLKLHTVLELFGIAIVIVGALGPRRISGGPAVRSDPF